MSGLTPAANAKLWAAIALVFIVAMLGAAPAMMTAPAGAHEDHHVLVSGGLDHLAAVGHDHIGAAATFSAPDAFTDALLPRLRIPLPVLGLIFALGLLWSLSPQHSALVGRDPPRRPLLVCPGRDVLAKLCISRR